eukprot:tig00000881_g5240.t1
MVAPGAPSGAPYSFYINSPSSNASLPYRFPKNRISTTKYTLLSFLPKNLLLQFKKAYNQYFLLIVLAQFLPGVSPVDPVVNMLPLIFVLAVTAIKDALEDYRRYRADKVTNEAEYLVLPRGQHHPGSKPEHVEWTRVQAQRLQVGDIIMIEKEQFLPADVLLLSTADPAGTCYVETGNLDGESNLKQMQAVAATNEVFRTPEAFATARGRVFCDEPNNLLYQFSGHLCLENGLKRSNSLAANLGTPLSSARKAGKDLPMTEQQLLLRGVRVRNTPWAAGVVVYTGADTKLSRNSRLHPPIKVAHMERQMNRYIVWIFIVQVIICVVLGAYSGNWLAENRSKAWYLAGGDSNSPAVFGVLQCITYFVLICRIVPTALIVSAELVRVASVAFMEWDVQLAGDRRRPSETRMRVKTSNLLDELPRVEHVFADKTGTLTENRMVFTRAWVPRPGRYFSEAGPGGPGSLWRALSSGEKGADAAAEMLLAMGLCNAVVPDPSASAPHERADDDSGAEEEEEEKGGRAAAPPDAPAGPAAPVSMNLEESQESGLSEGGPPVKLIPAESKAAGRLSPRGAAGPEERPAPRKPLNDPPREGREGPDPPTRPPSAYSLYAPSTVPDTDALASAPSAPPALASAPSAPPARSPVPPLPVASAQRSPRSSPRARASASLPPMSPHSLEPIRCPPPLPLSLAPGGPSRGPSRPGSPLHAAPAARMSLSAEPAAGPALPDEVALVKAARTNGVTLVARSAEAVRVSFFGVEKEYRVVATLKFTSERRRMSTVVQEVEQEGAEPGRVLLLTKGADEEIMGRLAHPATAGEAAAVAEAGEAVARFSTEGLRTLLWGAREMPSDEFGEWLARYEAAECIAEPAVRAERAEALADELERGLRLVGVSAVEDRLQRGVPAAIAFLRAAGVRVWLLTGDMQETAINIAHSSRLLAPGMELLKLHATSAEEARQQLADSCGAPTTAPSAARPGRALVVDGRSLALVLESPPLTSMLLDVAHGCEALVCCRVTPLQKARVVRAVREADPERVLLAIGDGANDVGMIHEAHVGVGILGNEGTQAAQASDIAVWRFAALRRLLALHGRQNALRMAALIHSIFYKDVLFALPLLWFSPFMAATGQALYADWIFAGFDVVFTSLPPIVLGCFEKDLDDSLVPLTEHPAALRTFRDDFPKRTFSARTLAQWYSAAVLHSIVIFFGVYLGVRGGGEVVSGGSTRSLYDTGVLVSTAGMLVILLKLALHTMHWTWVHAAASAVSFLAYVVWIALDSSVGASPGFQGTLRTSAGDAATYLLVVATVFAALLPDAAARFARRNFAPAPWERLQDAYAALDAGPASPPASPGAPGTGRASVAPSMAHSGSTASVGTLAGRSSAGPLPRTPNANIDPLPAAPAPAARAAPRGPPGEAAAYPS